MSNSKILERNASPTQKLEDMENVSHAQTAVFLLKGKKEDEVTSSVRKSALITD